MNINGLSNNEIKELAKETYIFSYPLILHYYTFYKHVIDQKSGEFTGGFGKFLHLGLVTPGDVDIVAPNNDTPYSLSWVDARSEPWVLVMPPVEPDRYCSAQFVDLWGFVVDNAGCIRDGHEGGAYLLTTRGWQGEIPEDVRRVIRGETPFLWCLIRIQLFEEAEFSRVREIQNSFKLMPLHEYLGTPAPAPAPEIQWMPAAYGDEKKRDAFKYVNFLLPFTSNHPFDAEHLEMAARLGIVPGLEWKMEDCTAEQQQAIADGIKEAIDFIDETSKMHSPPGERFNTRENMGKRYLHRAQGAYAGLGGNTPDQAVYLRLFKDENGDFLDASKHSYKITFKKEDMPDAKYFWSLTMYSLPGRFLVPNPLKRYSLGSRACGTLKHNPDGGFTLYFGKESPGKDRESNWLPAPNGRFTVTFRIFGPDEAAQRGEYQAPPIQVVS
jgi:hypothetical protein